MDLVGFSGMHPILITPHHDRKERLAMRKLIMLASAFIALTLLASCSSDAKQEAVMQSGTIAMAESAQETAVEHLNSTTTQYTTKPIPTYKPKSIKIEAEPDLTNGTFAEWGYIPTKRYIYYNISGVYAELADENGLDFMNELSPNKEHEEMALVMFIKRNNIKKEDFEKAIEKDRELRIKLGQDMTTEEYELPNADIIYTFNNKLINYYYRRQ